MRNSFAPIRWPKAVFVEPAFQDPSLRLAECIHIMHPNSVLVGRGPEPPHENRFASTNHQTPTCRHYILRCAPTPSPQPPYPRCINRSLPHARVETMDWLEMALPVGLKRRPQYSTAGALSGHTEYSKSGVL